MRGVYRQFGATRLGQIQIDVSKDWDGFQITNLADPAAAQDAATKNYVDTEAANAAKSFAIAMSVL